MSNYVMGFIVATGLSFFSSPVKKLKGGTTSRRRMSGGRRSKAQMNAARKAHNDARKKCPPNTRPLKHRTKDGRSCSKPKKRKAPKKRLQLYNSYKNNIRTRHNNILKSWRNDVATIGNTKINREQLYFIFINENDIEFKNLLDLYTNNGNNLPEWFTEKTLYGESNTRSKYFPTRNKKIWLERKIFGDSKIPGSSSIHVGIPSDIDVGPHKAVGYWDGFIMIPEYQRKYLDDNSYMILSSIDRFAKRIGTLHRNHLIGTLHVVHLPTLYKFVVLNPQITSIRKTDRLDKIIEFYAGNNAEEGFDLKFVRAIFGKKNIPGIIYPDDNNIQMIIKHSDEFVCQ